MLLASCERLFSNDIEQHAFEDQMRAVFGTKVCKFHFGGAIGADPCLQDAYKIFTIDKVIGVIIKQVGVFSFYVIIGLSNALYVGSSCNRRPQESRAA